MKKSNNSPNLRQLFLHIFLFRLFIPLILVVLMAVICFGYLGIRNLESRQSQVVESMSRIINYHIDHGKSILEAIARVAETNDNINVSVFMKSSWESYGYFDTIYYLDKNDRIIDMTPLNPRYDGIDMSNISNFKEDDKLFNIHISKPFISLRTGYPTIFLIRPLLNGGYLVGELNLELLQNEIKTSANLPDKDFVFIMDQSGTLIAHPYLELVKQQTNMSNLKIFRNIFQGKNTGIYSYDGNIVIGNAVILNENNWVVVDQISIYEFVNRYIYILVIVLSLALCICGALILNLKEQLNKYIITPIEQLIKKTNNITIGDFSDSMDFSPASTAFSELDKLFVDFQYMTDNLQARESALRESENRYKGLTNRMPIGIFRATLTGEILGVNPMFKSIFGFTNYDEVINKNILDIIYPYSIYIKRFPEYIKNLNNYEMKIKCNNGKSIWIQIDTHIVYNINKEAEFFEGCIQNITERKVTEAKIKEQQELLFKSEKEKRETLEKTLAMKDEFISLLSHEFKTPLNVIYSAIQLIEGVYINKIPERVQELIGSIKKNTFRQLRLSNNLLDVTKMNSGQTKLNMKNIDIVFLSRAITESIELYADQKDIDVYFESNLESKIINMDEEKFERILLNLLSNAMKFTESGGEISVRVEEIKNLNFIQIKVIDTGIGIPKDKQELIFERFGQVDNNLSRQAEGSGIGLSLVKSLVNLLEGTIEVHSEVGVGSTFTITLPVRNEEINNSRDDYIDFQNELVSKIKVEFSDIYL
ncbi:ATP-binding protein [Clostridium sp. C2-6-12]|uniref:sensor histidine kinase n=1 Tax=Clostridium sp. C2-6-12 TaxID=2698832 RepID=UPI00136AFA29|nr:ATP-binding protein [Clostridium sp. C2-6-12]